jgi:hypothetical protein
MIDRFLKAKHWQLFLLLFGVPMMVQFGAMIGLSAMFATGRVPDLHMIAPYFRFLPFILIVFTGFFFAWFYSIAIGLQGKLPARVKMKVRKFKIIFFTPIIYMSALMLFIATVVPGWMENVKMGGEIDIAQVMVFIGIALPLHFVSIACMFYTNYFVAKTVKTVELQKEVFFADFVGEFFLLWFYPVGIWVLQPKINQMAHMRSDAHPDFNELH